MNTGLKGYLYAFGASLALAASFVFSKSALVKTDMFVFGFTWFGVGTLSNLVWLFFRKRKAGIRPQTSGTISVAILIASLEGLATVLFYIAIQKMENPAVVSFIGNFGPVLVTLMGIILLKEKYSMVQLLGIILALGGVFVITFNLGTNMDSLIQPGSQYVLMASALFAIATVTARGKKEKLDTELMSTIRSTLLFLVFSGIIIVKKHPVVLSQGIWSDIVIGSILETLITIIFAYQALKYLEAARTSLIISTKAVWLVVMAWFFLDTFPMNRELAGGLISLTGIMLISLRSRQRSSSM